MKKTSRHAILAILLVVGSMLVGCRTEDPVVVCGRGFLLYVDGA